MIKKIILTLLLVDNFFVNFFKKFFRTKYEIIGKCNKCGNCCRKIYLKATNNQIKSDLFRKVYTYIVEYLYGFELIEIDEADNYFVFRCKHLKSDNTCANYKWRPPVCRNYPLVDYFKRPVFLEGCGFKIKI